MNEQKKVNRVNIYLSYQDKKILNDIRDKYHISYSTIASIIVNNLWTGAGGIWTDHYYYENDRSSKTSIKPRALNELSVKEWLKGGITITFTNCIKAFCRKEIGKITGWTDKEVQKRTSQIYNTFQNTYDPNWNGNEWQRRMPKLIKQNREYYKKLLEDN